MSRINVTFPNAFNSLSGQQPASELDDNFDAVPGGSITIGTRVKTGSYTLVADDEFSFFVCQPTNPMTLNLANVAQQEYSFFFSHQSSLTSKTIQLLASITVDGVPHLNPIFPTATVKGGLVWYDGTTWSMSSKLFLV